MSTIHTPVVIPQLGLKCEREVVAAGRPRTRAPATQPRALQCNNDPRTGRIGLLPSRICFRCFPQLLLFQICEKESKGEWEERERFETREFRILGFPTRPAARKASPWHPLWSTDSPSSATSSSGSRGTTSSSTMHFSNFTTRYTGCTRMG